MTDLDEVHGEGELLIVQHPVLVYVRQPPHLARSNVYIKLDYCMIAVWRRRQISRNVVSTVHLSVMMKMLT